METIDKNREPLPAMEAIYLITPSEKSVGWLMKDFQSQHRTQYRGAHVYFTEGKENNIFIWKKNPRKYNPSPGPSRIPTCLESMISLFLNFFFSLIYSNLL